MHYSPPPATPPPCSGAQVVLIHMNHTNPLWRPGSSQRQSCLDVGVRIGLQGSVFEL